MTAETEVAKEVAAIGEKCGLDVSSYQDLPKLNCNVSSRSDQVNGPDNSYVFVTGANGLADDPMFGNENLVAAKGLSVVSRAAVDIQIEKFDLLDEEVCESIKERGNGNVERSNMDLPVKNCNDIPLEQERLLEDGDGIPAVADAPEEQSEETESDVVAEIKSVEVPRLENLVEAETEVVGEHNGNSENVVETEIEPPIQDAEAVVTVASLPIQDPKSEVVENGIPCHGERLESLVQAETEAVGEQIGNSEKLIETEIEPPIQDAEAVITFASPPIQDPKSQVVGNGIRGRDERQSSLVEAETEAVGEKNGNSENVVETEIEPPIQDAEAVVTVASPPIQDPKSQSEETESDVMAEIKSVEVPNGRLESLVEAETEAVGEKIGNSENLFETETEPLIQDAEAVITVASPPIQDPKSQVVENGICGHDERQSSLVEAIRERNENSENVVETKIKPPIQDAEAVVTVASPSIKDPKSLSEETESDVMAEVKSVEVPNGRLESLVGAETEAVGEQNGNSENVLETEIKPPIQDPKSQFVENEIPGHDEKQSSCTNCYVSSGSEIMPDIDDFEEKEPAFQCGDEHVETEVSSVKTEVVSGPTSVVNVKLEHEVHGSSAATTEELNSDVTVTCGDETLDGFDVNNKDPSSLVLEKEDAGDLQDQLDNAIGSTDETSCWQENEDTEKSQSDTVSIPSPEDSSTDVISGGDTSIVVETKPFNFLVRVPRFGDESLKERIRLANVKVDETTKERDVIQVQIQEKRASSQTHGIDYEYAKREDRSARKLVRSKRMEIDSIQSVINKAKNATSIEDIDNRIYSIEHTIQHETLPLKEEKHLIREIKQLKQLREQLSSSLGTKDEIKQALEQREEAEEHLKILRKELDVLKDKVLKAEAIALEAERKYDLEIKKVKVLQAKYRAADDVRQEAFAQWQSLRKELSEKNKYFFKYKDVAAAAKSYAYRRERESLYRLCTNQLEKFMELWNTNDEFRKEYVSFNARSTVRRFGTLDGRSLGPDEQPPFLSSYFDEKRVHMRSNVPTPAKVDSSISQSLPELQIETVIENGASDDKLLENQHQAVKTKGAAKPPVSSDNGLATVSGRDAEVVVQEEEELVKSKEEIELARKAEEIRKQEADAKLREQRRLEGLVRAKEARERKKRQAEKLHLRAETKAQKEAEQKEKEREKRLRKKERKKAVGTDVNDSNNHSDSGESTVENGAKEIFEATKEIVPSSVVNKKPQKSKQSKMKSVPPPLRNRNRKKWQQYMYVGAASLCVLVLFWVGNMGLFSGKNLKRSGPFY